jgi:salicylate hydroxylase
MELQEELLGMERAHNSYLGLGPGGYVICYPIDGGRNVNIGLWPWKLGEWKHDEAWVLPNQKPQMLEDFAGWGPAIHRIMEKMGDDTAFWATFHHYVKPEKYYNGRVCMIGDASHAMCPHQGQGAAQSMEDACVMAEVLQEIQLANMSIPQSEQIKAALEGYEAVRKPRFEKALDTSFDGFKIWSRFWHPDLTQQDVAQFQKEAEQRFRWLWNSDIEGQGKKAKAETRKILAAARGDSRPMLA